MYIYYLQSIDKKFNFIQKLSRNHVNIFTQLGALTYMETVSQLIDQLKS